ncbi:hypothetical protein CLU79DRAFT_358441 [Phycomyces nitens]|nr:hypothetical protein CLU79DRAFT_358441 [Phycomyces nitens]
MMSDMFYDNQIDIQELYEVLLPPLSGFQCISHALQGCLVRYTSGISMLDDVSRRASLGVHPNPRSPFPSPSHPSLHLPQSHPVPPTSLPPLGTSSAAHSIQQQKGNPTTLFGTVHSHTHTPHILTTTFSIFTQQAHTQTHRNTKIQKHPQII